MFFYFVFFINMTVLCTAALNFLSSYFLDVHQKIGPKFCATVMSARTGLTSSRTGACEAGRKDENVSALPGKS